METAQKTVIECAVILGSFAVLYFLYLSRGILLYLVISIFLAVALQPLVVILEKWKVKRDLAIGLADLFVLIIFLAILALVVSPLILQGTNLIENLPNLTNSIVNNPSFSGFIQQHHLAESMSQLSSQFSTNLLGGTTSILSIAGNVISTLTSITVVIVLTVLLQFEGNKIWSGVLEFFSEKNKKTAIRVGERIMKAINGFVSGNLFISLIAGIVSLISLYLLDVPYAIALSAMVAVFDLVPLIGTAIATIVVGLIALTKGLLICLIAIGILLTYQFVESHIIQPLVYSKSVNLSALLVVIATILGAELGGVIGILLAIPVAAVIQILVTEGYAFFETRKVRS